MSTFEDDAASLPAFTDDPVDRLAHTVAAFEATSADNWVLIATSGMDRQVGAARTGLTHGDLRALLRRLGR